MTILQVDRWKQLLNDRLKHSRKLGLDEKFVKDIYQLVHDRSIKIQSDLMNKPIEVGKNGKVKTKKKVIMESPKINN